MQAEGEGGGRLEGGPAGCVCLYEQSPSDMSNFTYLDGQLPHCFCNKDNWRYTCGVEVNGDKAYHIRIDAKTVIKRRRWDLPCTK